MFLLMAFAAAVAITQLAFVGSWGRSLRWTTLLQGIAVGFLVCGFTAVSLQFAWTRAFAGLSGIPVAEVQDFASWTVDPVIEEVVKLAPLVLLAWLRPRVQRQLGYTDHLLYGAALGVGFELLEAALRYVRLGALAMPTDGGFLVDGNLSGIVVVPSPWAAVFTWQPTPAGVERFFGDGGDSVQHLVWTALAAVGIAWLARHRGALRLVGLVPLVVVTLDHANYNLRVQLSPPLSGWWSDAIAAVGAQLSWVLVAALVAAVVADRVVLARGRRMSPGLLLPGENVDGLGPAPVVRAAVSGLPWSAWVVWQTVLSRRAAVFALTAGEGAGAGEPELRDGVGAAVGELAKVLALPRDRARSLWRAAVRRAFTGFTPKALLSPWMIVWAIALLPAVAYLVVGGFPLTRGLQQAMTSPVGFWLLVAALAAGAAITVRQLPSTLRALRAVVEPSLHERRLRLQARLATAVASLGASGVFLVLAVVTHDPDARVARTFHVLDALSGALMIVGLALLAASFFLFPPVALVGVVGGGYVLVTTAAAGSFVVAVGASAILASLGYLLSEADAGGGSGGGGGTPPPRYTDNSSGVTRTYGRSVSDIKGQAGRWAERMRARGYETWVPPVRSPSKYGFADVTVTILKDGVVKGIRHFIYRG